MFHKKLFQKGDGIVIGVSGGPDSVALTQVLVELRNKYDLKLCMLHVNYGLRGENSDLDEKLVRNISGDLEIPLKVVTYSDESKGNAEQEMRNFRYEKFEKERKEKNFAWIAVGHTLDDQAETVLMNMIRGAGLKGIGGMNEKRGKIIRPLLMADKKEILEYLQQIKQEYRLDKSNFDEKLLRNKIRHKLIPFLKKEYNPKIVLSIAAMADNFRHTQKVVDECAKKTYNEIARCKESSIAFDVSNLKNISPQLCSFVFRIAVEELKGDIRDLENAHFFEFKKIIESTKGKSQQLEIVGLLVSRKGGIIELCKK